MSYCRFGGDSDVYLYEGTAWFVCCSCKLNGPDIWDDRTFPTHRDAARHLQDHRDAGHKVPDYAMERLLDGIGSERVKLRSRQRWFGSLPLTGGEG